MEALFNLMYFLVVGAADYDNGTISDSFLGINAALGNVFTDTVMWTGLSLIGLGIFYYYLVNGITGVFNGLFKFNYWWAWLLMLIIAAIIGATISYFQTVSYIYPQLADGSTTSMGPAGERFILMTTIYSMLFYYFFSLLFKRWSRYAKFTPH